MSEVLRIIGQYEDRFYKDEKRNEWLGYHFMGGLWNIKDRRIRILFYCRTFSVAKYKCYSPTFLENHPDLGHLAKNSQIPQGGQVKAQSPHRTFLSARHAGGSVP
jgi:hypothetical protein